MAIEVSHWSRRDDADRNALGKMALELCRAIRERDGVSDSRFYWAGPDTIVLQTTADSAEVFGRPPEGPVAGAFFALADLAHQTRYEQWMDPRVGQETYESAGR